MLSGSGSFYEKTKSIYTQYKLEINKEKLIPQAIASCKNDSNCTAEIPSD